MKRSYLTKALFTALLLSGSVAVAGSAYPEPTEPEVLFQDGDYISESGSSEKGHADHDEDTESNSSDGESDASSASAEAEILYQDTDYIENSKGRAEAAEKSSSSEKASKASSGSSSDEGEASSPEVGEEKEGDSMQLYIVGLVAFILAGLFFYNKTSSSSGSADKPKKAKASRRRKAKKGAAPAAVVAKDPSGRTGVSKYLDDQGMGTATGVSKYVEAQVESSATGVEKYLKNKV